MGKKRTSDGEEKPRKNGATTQKQSKRPRETVDLSKTPPGAQLPAPSTTTTEMQITEENAPVPKKQKHETSNDAPAQAPETLEQPAKPQAPPKREKRQKLPQLPDHVTLTKRPLHHPAPPTHFASSTHPKTIYLTATSPFVPTLKRIRHLLTEITKRHKQSLSAHRHPRSRQKARSKPVEANGKLRAADVEREIVEDAGDRDGVGGEEVYVKATGRAIERALQVGVHFQGEDDCNVRVEMGSVQAIDDISIKRKRGRGTAEDVDIDSKERNSKKASKGKKWKDEDIPETRIRTLSSVTVAIGLK
ncbi:hypothetical protein K458DRAFT_425875 [Lentithecium fluviatile CBS 122367]|uniref:Uncharacterized protein n=1 Tax=Lentithecium fluviatile CBS 122367 TaxID=1168545 RepID=A0A6G1JNI1_9PLEO|nr:hypothetical protein K458DRAFT_425875 [Lentithecium fluviatile CBS 122367]